MLDIDYLREPSFAMRLVYRYRSGVMKSAMRTMVENVGAPLGHALIDHSDGNFIAGLNGFFQGTHFADFRDSRLGAIEAAMRAVVRHRTGPVALFVPTGSKVFTTTLWSELERTALVIEEPLATAETLNSIIAFSLSTSDLSPPANLVGDANLRSFLIDRTKVSTRLDDILLDIDDYILTRMNSLEVGPPVEVDVRETALNRAVARYIEDPSPATRRDMLTQALLRGDSERLMVGALTSATTTYLRRLTRGLDRTSFEREHKAALTWSYALLSVLAGVAALDETSHPTWRAAPDLRTFLVLDLCVTFRRYFRGETSDVDDLLHRTRECMRRVPVLPASDEAAFDNLKVAIGQLCARLDQLPAAFGELKLLLATGTVIDAIPTRFSDRLTDIDDQPIAVEHLRQQILRRTQDGAILLHGPDAEAAERLSSAFARALLCEMPVNGDLCGNCVSCFDALNESSPHLVHVLLNGDPMVTAEAQIKQVRAAVWSRGLWPGKRVVVLVGADRVRKGAIDGLLKTVEESAALTRFIFVAQRLHDVSAALKSRCVTIALKKAVPKQQRIV